MRWPVVTAVLAACSSSPVVAESGLYEVTQQTGAPDLTTFRVTAASTSLTLDSAPSATFPGVTLAGSGMDFSTEVYSGTNGSCDAGGACLYTIRHFSADVPGAGLLHVYECTVSGAKCTMAPNPTCSEADARSVLVNTPCVSTLDVDARRIGP